MKEIVGSHNILFVTLDTLRYDVAAEQLEKGGTPHLARFIGGAWEKRHSPGSFTYAAHAAFFAGFLPTPADPQRVKEERLFAARFGGSETSGTGTFVYPEADLVTALQATGYHTACIGGVGFFNKSQALSRVFPDLFVESHWNPELGVTCPQSTRNQFALANEIARRAPEEKPLFLFINISALHQPNYFYLNDPGLSETPRDTLESHAAALRYVDSQWPLLSEALARRQKPWFFIVCSDHGTAYGEDGYQGHRLAHPRVWTVPFAAGIWNPAS